MPVIPPLKCPACNSTRCTKNSAGSVECAECGVKTTVVGNIGSTTKTPMVTAFHEAYQKAKLKAGKEDEPLR